MNQQSKPFSERLRAGEITGADYWSDPMAGRDPLDFFYRLSTAVHRTPGAAHGTEREDPIIDPATARLVANTLLLHGGPATLSIAPNGTNYELRAGIDKPLQDVVAVPREILIGLLALASTMPWRHEVTK